MRRFRGHLVATLGVVALAACGGDTTAARVVATAPIAAPGGSAPSASTKDPGSTTTTVSPGPASAAPTAAPIATAPPTSGSALRWTTCPDTAGFQCATLTVPVDYANPTGATLSIALNRRPANDKAKRIGSLVVNPGGPGGSGLELAAALPDNLPPALLDRFDLVGFDPRGVGASKPILCTTDAEKDARIALDDRPDTRAEIDALVQSRVDDGTACVGEQATLIPFLTTVATARDLDRIREALGDQKLTYLGFSYGTHLGATYAQLFPTSVRALVLDGVINPVTGGGSAGTSPEYDESWGPSFERAFDRFAAACLAAPTCPVTPDPRAVRDAIATRVETTPLPSGDDKRPVGPALFTQAVFSTLYDVHAWPLLAVALHDGAAGDGTMLLTLADFGSERDPDGHYTNLRDANHAINCADTSARASAQTVAAESATLTLPFDLAALDKVLYDADCAGTPVGKEPFTPIGPAVGAPPLLLVGTEGDPATDVANTAPMAKALGSGVAIFWDGDGHTAFTNGSECIDTAVVGYLVDLTVPTDGMHCAANPPGTANAPAQGVAYHLDRAPFQTALAKGLVDALGSTKAATCVAKAMVAQLSDTELIHVRFGAQDDAAINKVRAIAARC